MKSAVLVCLPLVALAGVAAGCIGFEHRGSSVTAPSDGSAASLLGTWASTSNGTFPTADSCTGLQWKITGQTATEIQGEFHVTCAGGVTLDGTVAGTLNGSTITFQGSGVASGVVPGACNFTVSGTGYIFVDVIQVNYTATTCLGPLSGSETLKRK